MKFDMHCHTKEGSIDAHVSLEQYVRDLINRGFDGMLVTDHNSYKGYEKWNEIKNKIETSRPFTVLKGIEYDTRDGGHFIAVLPEGVNCKLLELRGLTVKELEKLVHRLGGILGPAHPYGTGFFAFMHTRAGRLNKKMMEKFDFVETFNSCTHPQANAKARALAEKWELPHFAGSDSHRLSAIGTAFTEFHEQIKNNDDLIHVVKDAKNISSVPNEILTNVYRNSNVVIRELGVIGYYLYNKLGAALRFPARKRAKRHYAKLL